MRTHRRHTASMQVHRMSATEASRSVPAARSGARTASARAPVSRSLSPSCFSVGGSPSSRRIAAYRSGTPVFFALAAICRSTARTQSRTGPRQRSRAADPFIGAASIGGSTVFCDLPSFASIGELRMFCVFPLLVSFGGSTTFCVLPRSSSPLFRKRAAPPFATGFAPLSFRCFSVFSLFTKPEPS